MRNLMVTAIVSAALGCAAGYALAPDGESGTNAALLADGAPMGRGPGVGGGRGGLGHGGVPNVQRGGPGGRPATGFDLSDLERSLAHMSVELALEDAQQQAIRDVMQEYRRRMREMRGAIVAELTAEQRERLRAVEAAGSPGRVGGPGGRREPPER